MTNAFQHTRGYLRTARLLLDDHKKNSGQPIRTRTLEGFTASELDDVIVAFGRHHVDALGEGRFRIHIDRIIRDDYAGDQSSFWKALQGVAPTPPKTSIDKRTVLAAYIDTVTPDTLQRYLQDQLRGSGWLSRLTQQATPNAAREETAALVRAAQALMSAPAEPTPIKSFASNVLNDSHRLDSGTTLYRRLTDYLAILSPETDKDDPDWRRVLLEEYNLYNSSIDTLVHVAGPILLVYEDGEDDRIRRNIARGFSTTLGVDEIAGLRRIVAPRVVLTCEGAASFTQLARIRLANLAIICTHGHPNPAVRRFLQLLQESGCEFRHWGDTDVGGFRVLATLRRTVPIQSILMDAATIQANAKRLTPFTSTKRQHIEAQFARMDAAAQHTLDACLQHNGWLEQESIPLPEVLDRIASLTIPLIGNGLPAGPQP